MPLMFVISGASLCFSVDKPGKFARDKVLRVLFGMKPSPALQHEHSKAAASRSGINA
jgi:hypothetical protein